MANFGEILSNIAIGANQSVRRNAGDTAFEAFTPGAGGAGDVVKVGTPVNNQVGVWTGDGTIEGDVDLTFDTTTNTLGVGLVGLDARVQVHAVKSDASDGLLVEAANGTDVGVLGVGNTANATWYGSHNFDTATQDTVAAFTGAGKTLGSLATATYPSLTELSYVKGVTSAIQTQINGKAASGANTDITSVYLNNTGLKIKDTNASHGLIVAPGSDLTVDRTLTITTGDADRTLTISASATVSGTNTGDQTSIVGITGTLAQFNTAVTDAELARTDAGQTFTGVQTFSSAPVISSITNTGTITIPTQTGTLLINTSTAGVGTTPTSSTTTAVTHSLGRTPTIIRIWGKSGFTSNAAATPTTSSEGVWNSSGNFCIYQSINGTTTINAQTSNTFAIFLDTSVGNTISGVIQNVGATTFDIVWTETGTHTRGVYMWEAQ